ncbi:MAG: hypothetical protein V3V00_03575, partial [Saprospiraceae bacterium]
MLSFIKKVSVGLILSFGIFTSISSQTKITGITMVAPPSPFKSDPMPAIKRMSSKWVALVPYAFIASNNAIVRFGSDRQWWGERKEGIVESIKRAKDNNMRIMIKPQIWMHGKWIGDMDYESESDWKEWEESYEEYIMTFVDIAIKYDVEMICIGTEIEIASKRREAYWRKLIKKIRDKYEGLLTYSSNWDS